MSLVPRSTALRPSFSLCFYPLLAWFLLVALSPPAWSQTTYTGTVDFGTVNVGSASGTQTLTFSFFSPTSLNVTTPVQVLTQGTPGLDFKSAGTGSCAGSTYSTCTVDVTFSPMAPGLRMGAVILEDTSGNVLATAYIHGIGQGPQITFNTGTQTTVGANFLGPGASAVDAAGNVYVADTGSNEIWKVAPGGIQTRLPPFSGYSGPVGIAVDGAGNLYIAFSGTTGEILKETPAGVMTTVGSGIGGLDGLATDGLGNLYVVNQGANVITVLTPAGTQSNIGTGLFNPSGVAVDAVGNVYISDTQNYRIVKVAPGGAQTTLVSGSPLWPEAIAVDAAGNIYVADAGTNKAFEYSPTGALIRTLASGLNYPVGITVDSLGNVYIAQGTTLVKLDRSTPPTIGFVTGTVGTTTSDSPRAVAVENDGNATLTFPVPVSGTNPAITPTDFSLDSTTICPNLTPSSPAAGTLAGGASCIYAIDYKPSTTASVGGSLIITDNTLNTANATQSITLNNQGTPVIIVATVTVVQQFGVPFDGNPHPLTVTTAPAGLTVTVTYQLLGSSNPATTTAPSQPGIYMVTAVVTQTGYSGGGSGYLQIVSPPTPTLTWATPAPMTLGTPLSATQLNATANTPGTFTYSIPAGTVLALGSYPITVNFVANDTVDFSPNASATVTLVVQATNTQTVTPVSFGTVNVGATSLPQTVSFTFINPVTLGSAPVAVLTQGLAGLDFKNTNAGNCAAGPYAASVTCTVTVSFTPAVPGPRLGSVVLLDASGNALATAFIGGIGQGPQIVYDPGVKSIFAPNIATYGLAIDAAGNAYLNDLDAIVKVTPGGVQTTVASGPGSTSLHVSGVTAIDGAGNLYTLNLANSVVYEITPSGAQYQVGSGWVFPTDLAVDTAGNLYVTDRGYNPPPDTTGGRLTKISAAGIQTTMAGPFVMPDGVAVDGAGNVYVTDNAGLGIINPGLIGVVYKVTPGGTLSTVASGLFSPNGIAVDAAGNLFVTTASSNTSIDRITQAGARTKIYDGQVSFPETVKIAPSGDVYITQAVTGAQLVKFDRSTVPSFAFASTAIGSVSSDSPQAFTLENIGNATLSFPNLSTGSNASISANFFLTHATTCPQSTAASTLASGASCVYSAEFLPSASGPLTGSLTLTDNALNVNGTTQVIALSGTGTAATIAATVTLGSLNQTYTGSPLSVTATTTPTGLAVAFTYNGSATPPTAAGTYTVVGTVTTTGYTGSATGSLIIAKATPVLTWAIPTGISAGTALSATQLNATASVAGSFVYTPAIGAIPATGTDTLSVTFTPTDTTDYTTATTTVSLAVGQTTPVLTWATPAAIAYGTALSGIQLNATASVAGSFSYSPAAGAIPAAGFDSLTVTFTPTDTTDYTTATKTVSLVVNQATPVLTWATPAAIPYGTVLSATQLNATASVSGTFLYSPAAGATPATGTDTLSVTFTPTDATDYTTATKTVSLVVNQAAPVLTWATPAAIPYGTVLSATQLNATASVPGTFLYSPAADATPTTGTDTLSVTFTPNDATDYTTATKTVSLAVNQATPTITWATPAAISYGTTLSATQLNATASVAGAFVYTPAIGATLAAGTDTLSVTFTPTDTTDYIAVTKTVSLVVSQAAPVITWATPASIPYGTTLSAAQLNATASVPGTFSYNPAAGTTPVAGTDSLSVTFTPADATDYAVATKTVSLVVGQATPVITWATPASISFGTALSTTQLNATASVPGTFVYTPAAGATPAMGTDPLSVTFTPTDAVDYTMATKTVSLVVAAAAPVITWATPAAITFGTALSATQLNATASVPGTFLYGPTAGTTPSVGTDTLSVTFTPTDAVDYSTATKTVSLVVNQATPTVTWASPAAISYGTALSATQLNATASVAGAFVYTPAVGATPAVGTDTLSVTFTPTDTTDYTAVTKTVSLVVGQVAPVISWATPASISYGTALSATQLNATASVPGTFLYTPAAGTTPAIGTDTLSVTFTPTDTTDYTSATKTVSLVVAAAAPVITWATPAAITYGTALSATQLNATASVAGSFTYNPAAGTILTAGAYTLNTTFTPTDTTDYSTATKTVGLTVNPAPLSLTANNATRIFGTVNPVFTGTVTGAQTGDTFTEAFTTTATSLSNVGTYPIVPSVTGSNLASYTQTATNGSLSITQAGSTTALTLSSTSISPGQSVTLTAQVASATTGTPTGTVQFFDGTTLLNTATLSSGTATYATSTLSLGTTHAITAVYPGDTNFTGSNGGAAKTVTVSGSLDFSITPITLTNTVLPGVSAIYSFQIAPASGVYPASVTFAATGLPAGAIATFSPATIPVTGGAQTVTVSIQTAAATAATSFPGHGLGTVALGLLLLPFAGTRRLRRSGRRLARIGCLMLLLAAGAAVTAGLTGCGASNGFFGEAQRAYTVILTATSGTVQHTTTVTLNVQ
jgi:sugar lactone lactonase YvrE